MDAETQRNLAVTALVVTIVVAAIAVTLVATYRIHNVGKVKAIGVGVFWDPACTLSVQETGIDWELIEPGELKGATVYIKSTKNVNFTMTINTTEWNPPEAEQYFTLDWNYTGEVLHPTDVITTLITLYLDPFVENITDFSFTIGIVATEATD